LLLAGLVAGQQRLSVRQRVLLGLAVALCATAGSGLIELPSLEQVARRFGSTLGPYTYVLVGVMAFLETGGAVGLIAPGELIVILGGVAAGQGEVELVPLIAIVWGCAVAGDIVSFFLGRRLGRGFLLAHGHRIKLTPARLQTVEGYFARHGGKTIVVGRFIGVVRSLAPAIAGASRMPARRFIPATVVGAGLWAGACASIGYLCWMSIDDALALVKEGSIAIALLAAVSAVVALVVRRRQAARGRTPDALVG
jgi:undecaprenyl-diphosphatase